MHRHLSPLPLDMEPVYEYDSDSAYDYHSAPEADDDYGHFSCDAASDDEELFSFVDKKTSYSIDAASDIHDVVTAAAVEKTAPIHLVRATTTHPWPIVQHHAVTPRAPCTRMTIIPPRTTTTGPRVSGQISYYVGTS